jgi:hypothetical protein
MKLNYIIKSLQRRCKKINKKSSNKNITHNIDVSNDTTNVSSNNFTMKTLNEKEYTKEHLAIMEPVTASQSFRSSNQPLISCPSNKIKILLDSGSNGDLYFLPIGEDKPFPYLTRQAPKSWCTSNGSSDSFFLVFC